MFAGATALVPLYIAEKGFTPKTIVSYPLPSLLLSFPPSFSVQV